MLSPGRSRSAQDIVDACRARLTGYKKPKHVVFLESLPMTATGKVRKAELRDRWDDIASPSHVFREGRCHVLPVSKVISRQRRAGPSGAESTMWLAVNIFFFHTATPNAFVALGAAAGATGRIRLLTSLAVAPLYPAVLLTKPATTLDLVSGGGLDLGLSVGREFPAEFVAAGVDVRERGARTDETLAVMTALWTGEPVTHTGRSVHIPGLRLDPQPIQAPRPPLWMGGRRAAAIRRAGRYADVWMPYLYTPDQLQESLSRCMRKPNVAVGTHLKCAGRSSVGEAWTPTPSAPGRPRSRKSARSTSKTSPASPTATCWQGTPTASLPGCASTAGLGPKRWCSAPAGEVSHEPYSWASLPTRCCPSCTR